MKRGLVLGTLVIVGALLVAVEYPQTLAKVAATLKNIDTVITGHSQTTLSVADLKTYAGFIREFVQTVQAAKRAGRTMDDVVNTWKTPASEISPIRPTRDASFAPWKDRPAVSWSVNLDGAPHGSQRLAHSTTRSSD